MILSLISALVYAMVTYLASGERDYNVKSIKPYARWSWEIFAVQKGFVSLWLPDGVQAAREKTLWIFPPGHVHGWKGSSSGKARVTIFLIEDLPDPVGSWATEQGQLAFPISPVQSKQFQAIYEWASPHWVIFDELRDLRWKKTVLDLAVLIGGLANKQRLARRDNRDVLLVESAIRLFSEHLADGWNLERVCEKLPVSLAQLRRLFIKVLRTSPRDIFEDIRFRRAMELIMIPNVKLETVAFECGYQSIAAFSRAFKRRCYIYPSEWQKDENLRRKARKKYNDSKWSDEYKKLQLQQPKGPFLFSGRERNDQILKRK